MLTLAIELKCYTLHTHNMHMHMHIALSIVAHMLCTPYATSFLNVIELVNLVCVLLSASANMVAFGTEHEEVIEYAAAIYVFAQVSK